MEEKIPCIECNTQLWEYIEPYLKEWEYHIDIIADIKEYPLIVINYNNRLGKVINTFLSLQKDNNRELVTNVEEFLERAAKLKGFIYKRKNIMQINGVEIKPGMIVEVEINKSTDFYVVFPLLNNKLGVISYCKKTWGTIEDFMKYYLSKIISIRDLTSEELEGISGGKILWERPKEVGLTMQEIADKFGIPIEQLKIKK